VGVLINLSNISNEVPSGHIHPQKNRPKNIEASRIRKAGQKMRGKFKLSIKLNKGIRGEKRRNRSLESPCS
jgi:hypothetical protein